MQQEHHAAATTDRKNGGYIIKNKVALVTGVSSGIGQETAQLLAEPGARVFGTVRDPTEFFADNFNSMNPQKHENET